MNAKQAESLAREIQELTPTSVTTYVAPILGDRYGVKLVHKEHFLWIKSEETWTAVQEYVHLLGYEDLLVSIYDLLKHQISEAQCTEILLVNALRHRQILPSNRHNCPQS